MFKPNVLCSMHTKSWSNSECESRRAVSPDQSLIKCKCKCLQSYIPLNSTDFTIYTSGIGTLSLIQCHLLWGEFSFCTLCCSYSHHYNLAFSFHQVPITAGWTEGVWYEGLAQQLYTWPVSWPCGATCVGVIGPARLFHISSVDCCTTSNHWTTTPHFIFIIPATHK